ncbi:hypothetical protein BU25DRAFT_405299 [Macroventuria anomochaeta]|uniref:Uncharacterized protein n=1 Tax=Macroventuria anomochaeta TaxID=301207 RepID=A0ACB6SHF6_9PLEO|nr:uncharacterized protein BU25DRAFT_405299 [Macroventuria anomochaeta]KAF2633403.1 hypothetical protein BU25DRAFT_405299 [Macroventuria anomochaeta]
MGIKPLSLSMPTGLPPVQQEYARSLQMLARLPKLETFLLRGPPWLRGNYSAMERQWRYAQVADEIIRVLAKAGSSVSTLAFSPAYRPSKDIPFDVADENGHIWPRYRYKRDVVFEVGAGREMVVKHIAVPCPFPVTRLGGLQWEGILR